MMTDAIMCAGVALVSENVVGRRAGAQACGRDW